MDIMGFASQTLFDYSIQSRPLNPKLSCTIYYCCCCAYVIGYLKDMLNTGQSDMNDLPCAALHRGVNAFVMCLRPRSAVLWCVSRHTVDLGATHIINTEVSNSASVQVGQDSCSSPQAKGR